MIIEQTEQILSSMKSGPPPNPKQGAELNPTSLDNPTAPYKSPYDELIKSLESSKNTDSKQVATLKNLPPSQRHELQSSPTRFALKYNNFTHRQSNDSAVLLDSHQAEVPLYITQQAQINS